VLIDDDDGEGHLFLSSSEGELNINVPHKGGCEGREEGVDAHVLLQSASVEHDFVLLRGSETIDGGLRVTLRASQELFISAEGDEDTEQDAGDDDDNDANTHNSNGVEEKEEEKGKEKKEDEEEDDEDDDDSVRLSDESSELSDEVSSDEEAYGRSDESSSQEQSSFRDEAAFDPYALTFDLGHSVEYAILDAPLKPAIRMFSADKNKLRSNLCCEAVCLSFSAVALLLVLVLWFSFSFSFVVFSLSLSRVLISLILSYSPSLMDFNSISIH